MQRFWSQRQVVWPEPIAKMITDAGCEVTTFEPEQSFAKDPRRRAQSLYRTHFRVDHDSAGMLTFAVERPVFGGYEAYQREVRERVEWGTALLQDWSERMRACPRNAPQGRHPRGTPGAFFFPVGLQESLSRALLGMHREADLRRALADFMHAHAERFPKHSTLVLRRGVRGEAVEILDERDTVAVEAAWDDFFGRKAEPR